MSAPELHRARIASGAPFESARWEYVLGLFKGGWSALGAFAACYLLLTLIGYHYRAHSEVPAVLWPAAGLLFSALWMCPRRGWPAVLLVQLVVDVACTAITIQPFPPGTALLYALSNGLGGVIGVALARWLVSARPEFHTTRSLQMLLATAVGSAAGALPGVWANYRQFASPMGFVTQLEIWAAGNWLGIIAVVPVLITWITPRRVSRPELALRSRTELAVLVVLLAVVTLYVFSPETRPTSLLQVPFTLAAVMLYGAYRLPPRWVALLAMLVSLAAVELAGRGGGQFGTPDPFARHALLQGSLAAISVMSFVMSLALTEIRLAASDRSESESRYRSLVELSADAIWRVELDEPMPSSLPPEEQVAWLRGHARVAESNDAYRQVDPGTGLASDGHWQHQLPWSGAYEARIAEIISGRYSIEGLRFTTVSGGRTRTYLAAFSGVMRDGALVRIWGVASDITELVDLNARLQREQDRLRTYARQIVTAEEKARRATAVDLHDGIGQSLVGMGMTLNVARESASPEVRLLIDEVRARLHEVQERTRHMISDLSPPGLYDLGLGPALQWLSVYLQGHNRLNVDLQLNLREQAVRLDTRVLVFKLVRELLRNVVKHAGVSSATVRVQGNDEELLVEVADNGRGFNAQLDLFGGDVTQRGFGLWSIADRVQEVGGRFSVDTAPGRGARFLLRLPLQLARESGTYAAIRQPA